MVVLLVILLLLSSFIRSTTGVECFESQDNCSLSSGVCTASTCYMRIIARANPRNITEYQYSYIYGCMPEEEEGNYGPSLIASLCSGPASWSGGLLFSYTCCTSDHCNKNIKPRHDIESLLMHKYSNDQEASSVSIVSITASSYYSYDLSSLPTSDTSTTNIPTSTTNIPTITNYNLITVISNEINNPQQTINIFHMIILILTLLSMIVVCVVFILCSHLIISKRGRATVTPSSGKSAEDIQRINEILSMSSGSGMGQRILTSRTIAMDIELHEHVGRGTFGSISRCTYRGNTFTVKRFKTMNESSFLRELSIYSFNLRQDNVLSFTTADMISIDGAMECWLILNYCPRGSLYNELSSSPPSLEAGVKMVYSACMGLSYLHTFLKGYQSLTKPRIAHRDIKSKNILMKDAETCCIADFGLSIADTEDYESFVSLSQGTVRYMPPEVLNKTINVKSFLSFLQADVYSFGLVMWEVFNRCKIEGDNANEHQLPYYNELPSSPSVEDAKRLIVDEKKRPAVSEWPDNNKFLKGFAVTIKDSWSERVIDRPVMELIRKRIDREAKNADITLRH